jgi:hypothetical protein
MSAVLKLHLAAILIVATAAGVLWIERDHRIVIDAPASDVASLARAVCPDSDTVPYTPSCIAFLKGTDEERADPVSIPTPQ